MSSSTTVSSAPGVSSSSRSGGVIPPGSSISGGALFREIHKNTWLKRLTAEGKKITVGPKKSERSWVVFCVHDDTEALLEGYAEPRQAASHNPEWVVSMQETQHISHALIPNSHEFEFVVTLSEEVVRFHAMSWEIMQEWVETLRSKLREMKILSPRENLYTKLPEVRAPLLPTRDPTSPLPATPPVPAAIVPGVERVMPQQTTSGVMTEQPSSEARSVPANVVSTTTATPPPTTATTSSITPANMTSMSNTLTQNLLNMLSDPISNYSVQLNDVGLVNDNNEEDNEYFSDISDEYLLTPLLRLSLKTSSPAAANKASKHKKLSVAKTFVQNESGTTHSSHAVTSLENSVRVDIALEDITKDETVPTTMPSCERLIPRAQTTRSLSVSDHHSINHVKNHISANASNNNITELEIRDEEIELNALLKQPHQSSPLKTTVAGTAASAAVSKTSSSLSSEPITNITIIQVSNISTEDPKNCPSSNTFTSTTINTNTTCSTRTPPIIGTSCGTTPPPKSSNHKEAEFFKFPEIPEIEEYKSNVQIIPSNLSTIPVGSGGTVHVQSTAASAIANQYSSPAKKKITATSSSMAQASGTGSHHLENHKITTVRVVGNNCSSSTVASAPATTVYGTLFNSSSSNANAPSSGTPKLPRKIILSTNSSGVTNIAVNNDEQGNHQNDSNNINATGCSDAKHNKGSVHYEKVFLTSSIPISAVASSPPPPFVGAQSNISVSELHRNSPRRQQHSAASASGSPSQSLDTLLLLASPPTATAALKKRNTANNSSPSQASVSISSQTSQINRPANFKSSPAMCRKQRVFSPPEADRNPPVLPIRPPFLTRGLTEAVITCRPSRRDLMLTSATAAAEKIKLHASASDGHANNNGEATHAGVVAVGHAAVDRTRSESLEQRRRSSSTSDAQSQRPRNGNNNEQQLTPANRTRIQQQPQPFRIGQENNVHNQSQPASSSKRMTLREQQVLQLRREIMHPGGVRLQLRRKDCVGSIAWVDAFGAVWVAGWKQKEHPVLYNALHIGDQLISIAGITISSAAEANKIIRNANTLFVEVLIRRIPFGRGYAIRREREGQCLGLIRDGNTSTIVDVVPNSLAARHGLPPKAQSCDGTTLTFWILTEINGRPLNLFFKENEIRDRLNSVGRDISILVQPSDLITKLKKQLKSLRGHKDYLVQ